MELEGDRGRDLDGVRVDSRDRWEGSMAGCLEGGAFEVGTDGFDLGVMGGWTDLDRVTMDRLDDLDGRM